MPHDTARHVLILLETSREYGRGLLRGISRYSGEQGNWIIERPPFFYQSDSAAKDAFRLEEGGRIDGVIMRDFKLELPAVWNAVPVVYASYRTRQPRQGVEIRTDDAAIAAVVFKHYCERGIRQLAFLGYRGMFWSEQRLAAMAARAREAGLVFASHELDLDTANRQEDRNRLKRWLRELPRPVGIMACNDDCGQQALAACREEGLRAPQDYAVVGIDNDEFVCDLIQPPMSSVALNLEQAGYEAAAALEAMMQTGRQISRSITVEPAYVVTRQSSDLLAVTDPVVIEAVRYVYAHLDTPVQVNDIQRELAVARRVLYARFQQNLGCSVHAFIKKARVEKIKTLLRETGLTVSQIASQMGFPGTDHFAKYFRSVEGVNPMAYRKRYRQG